MSRYGREKRPTAAATVQVAAAFFLGAMKRIETEMIKVGGGLAGLLLRPTMDGRNGIRWWSMQWTKPLLRKSLSESKDRRRR
jgi:hypothetical protein